MNVCADRPCASYLSHPRARCNGACLRRWLTGLAELRYSRAATGNSICNLPRRHMTAVRRYFPARRCSPAASNSFCSFFQSRSDRAMAGWLCLSSCRLLDQYAVAITELPLSTRCSSGAESMGAIRSGGNTNPREQALLPHHAQVPVVAAMIAPFTLRVTGTADPPSTAEFLQHAQQLSTYTQKSSGSINGTQSQTTNCKPPIEPVQKRPADPTLRTR